MEIKLVEGGVLPVQSTEKAACHDVFARKIEKVADDFYIVYIGFAVTPPKGHKIVLVPRSSLTKTTWLVQNSPGQGDEDYVNEYQYRFRAIPTGVEMVKKDGEWVKDGYGNEISTPYSVPKLTYDDFPFKEGERIGQIYLEKVLPIKWKQVEQLKTTNRIGGFGSTGK